MENTIKERQEGASQKDKQQGTPVIAWILLFVLSLIWGSSFILIKKSLIVYTPMEVASLRIAITFLAFLPFLIYQFREIPWRQWKFLALVGLTGNAIPAILFPLAETQISSSVAGILNSLTPLFTLILGFFVFKISVGSNKVVGVLLGFSGAALLIWQGQGLEFSGNSWFSFYIVGATVCYAISTNIVKYFFQDLPPIPLGAASFSFIGIPAFVHLFVQGTFAKFYTHEGVWLSFASVSILALAGTFLGIILFYKLLQLTNVVFASMVAYLIPTVAVLLGFLDGETISSFHFLGMGMILVGVYLSKGGKK